MRYKTSRSMVHAEREVTRVGGMGPLAIGVWLWPWVATMALMPLGAALWWAWGRDPTAAPWGSAGVALAVTGLAMFAWRSGHARGMVVRRLATLHIAAGGAWLLMAMLTTPWGRPTVDLWGGLVVVAGLTWTIRRGLRGNNEGSSGWDALAERVKLPGSRVIDIQQNGAKTTATVEVAPGVQTGADVGPAGPHIASLLRVPPTAVRVEEDPHDGARATLTVVAEDQLRDPIPWSGPSRRGRSIAEWIDLGKREGGEPLGLWLPGDARVARSATHVLITGMTGAAKSWTGRVLDVEIASRYDTQLVIIDVVKGSQYLRPFAGVDRITTIFKHDIAAGYINGLPGVISDRADELGRRGYDDWEPGCGLPYLVVHVEEAAALLANSRPGARAAQWGRSAGVSLIVSVQRAVNTNLAVDIRQQIGATLAFGCEAGDEKWCGLKPETLARGAAPQNWGNAFPGYCYGEVPGVDAKLWHIPARAAMARRTDIMTALGTMPAGVGEEPAAAAGPVPEQATGASRDQVSKERAQELFLARLRELREQGVNEIRPAHFREMLNAAGRSPAWLTAALGKVTEGGVLNVRAKGVYAWPDSTPWPDFTSRPAASSARPDARA